MHPRIVTLSVLALTLSFATALPSPSTSTLSAASTASQTSKRSWVEIIYTIFDVLDGPDAGVEVEIGDTAVL